MKGHFYLKEIKHKPFFLSKGKKDGRFKKWKNERKKYGFDERQTWSLDYTMIVLLYERIKMYNEVNCVDTTYHRIRMDGVEITLQDCIDDIIEYCEEYLTSDEFDNSDIERKIWNIWLEIHPYMWW